MLAGFLPRLALAGLLLSRLLLSGLALLLLTGGLLLSGLVGLILRHSLLLASISRVARRAAGGHRGICLSIRRTRGRCPATSGRRWRQRRDFHNAGEPGRSAILAGLAKRIADGVHEA